MTSTEHTSHLLALAIGDAKAEGAENVADASQADIHMMADEIVAGRWPRAHAAAEFSPELADAIENRIIAVEEALEVRAFATNTAMALPQMAHVALGVMSTRLDWLHDRMDLCESEGDFAGLEEASEEFAEIETAMAWLESQGSALSQCECDHRAHGGPCKVRMPDGTACGCTA